MEIKKTNLLVAMFACLAACSDDATVDNTLLPDNSETTTVKFEMNANTGNYYSPLSRSVNPAAITKDNFRIMAFKKTPAGEGYFYAQDIPTAGMNYENNVLSGTVRLPIGEYKFVSTYGLTKDGGFALPSLTPVTTELTDDLNISHGTVDGSSVFFLEKGTIEALHSYTLGINPTANESVSASLSRAVSRVDIMFIQAKKNDDGTYTEVSDSADVFGVSQLADIEMQFTGLNRNVNLLGTKITTDEGSLFNENFTVPDLGNTVTRGTSTDDTKVGTTGFLNYDNIKTDDIKTGSAHVHGAYLLPYDEAINTTNLTLVLTNGLGDKRTIVAPKNLPLERNKVTLVKIYVLSGTVFNTDVKFNVTIDTAWLEANSVDGEIN